MSQYIELPVKDSEDVYYIQDLNVRDIRQVVNKCLALLSPLIGDGLDSYQEQEQESIRAFASVDLEDSDSLPDEPSIKLFSVFAVLGNQLDNPLVIEVQDLLLKGAKFSNRGKVEAHKVPELPDYSIDDARGSKAFSQYMKVLRVSFERNAYHPFIECLNEAGFSEIVGKVQAVILSKLPT